MCVHVVEINHVLCTMTPKYSLTKNRSSVGLACSSEHSATSQPERCVQKPIPAVNTTNHINVGSIIAWFTMWGEWGHIPIVASIHCVNFEILGHNIDVVGQKVGSPRRLPFSPPLSLC